MDTAEEVNPSVQPAFEIGESTSHTLQSRDFEETQALRARLIEAAVEALAEGSDPRLRKTRPWS